MAQMLDGSGGYASLAMQVPYVVGISPDVGTSQDAWAASLGWSSPVDGTNSMVTYTAAGDGTQTSHLMMFFDATFSYVSGTDCNAVNFLANYPGNPPTIRAGNLWLDTSTSPPSIAYSPDGSTVLHLTAS